MPELPEVETIKRDLSPELTNKEIVAVKVFLEKAIKTGLSHLQRELPGRRIVEVTRRGKYLLLILDGQKRLAFHLRMTGRLLYLPEEAPVERHTSLILKLNDGCDLRLVDQRKFGTVHLFSPEDPPKGLVELGPEPLEEEREALLARLREAAARRKISVKGLLLDQRLLAGLGNIYTDEALFEAGINPSRLAKTLTAGEWERLYDAICQVLAAGIEHRGTTRRDYVDGMGRPGDHQYYLKVYGRRNQACLVCGEKILYSRVAGRGTHYCPSCQQ